MPTFHSDNAECLIYTFKEGLLSKVAHDLLLKVTAFEIRWENGEIAADFDPRSIVVVNAMKRGQENPSALSSSDKQKVLDNMHNSVLNSGRFPSIRFSAGSVTATEQEIAVDGYLELSGKTRPIRAIARKSGGHWEVEVPIRQPDFGIRPYKAMMGAIKIKPEVKVVVRFPAQGGV